MFKIAIVVPTYNGYNDVQRLLNALSLQHGEFDVLIVDSTSTDGTSELLEKHETVTHFFQVSTNTFNHGGTRQKVVDKYPDYDIYVFMTQDAYPSDRNAVREIVDLFKDEKVGAVCGRQLPHLDADEFASHARLFNYPDVSSVKAKSDIPLLGLKVPFISNSFSAYRKKALQEVGGFPSDVILAEDMYVAAKMVLLGWKIGYSANAQVHHSHNYSSLEEWKRYFDIGVFHSQQPWIKRQFGGAGGEGMRFVKSELQYLQNKRQLWLTSILRNGGKLIAYKLGHVERLLPKWLKKRLSMHSRYW